MRRKEVRTSLPILTPVRVCVVLPSSALSRDGGPVISTPEYRIATENIRRLYPLI
jgi:hypothetical protein